MRQFVGVVLVKTDGSVLSQHRDNKQGILGPDTWCVVGGAQEADEDLKAAAARELLEETGYKVDPNQLDELTGDEYVTEKGNLVKRTIYWDWYDGKQNIETYEGQEIRFINPIELASLKFYQGHEGFLRKASEKAVSRGVESL